MSNKSRGKRKMEFSRSPLPMSPELAQARANAPGQLANTDPKAQQAMQILQQMQGRVREQIETELFIKPFEQEIRKDDVWWQWDIPTTGFNLTATYTKATNIYNVFIVKVVDELQSITPEDAILIGNALRSAGRWESMWRQHLGELMFPEEEKIDLDRMHPGPAPQRFE